MVDWTAVRSAFPAADRCVYLDSAAVGLMPRAAQQALTDYHAGIPFNAGVRLSSTVAYGGVGEEADGVTAAVASARAAVARVLGTTPRDVAFVKNATEAMSAVADGLVWSPGDEILISEVEHQSGALPWLRLADEREVSLRWVPADTAGRVNPADVACRIGPRTRAIVLIHVSSLLGTVQAVEDVGRIARQHELVFVVDGAQAVGRVPVDVRRIGCDFLVVSGRKGLLGPQGVGLLVGREGSLGRLRALTIGSRSALVSSSSDEHLGYTMAEPPLHLEAGALNTAGAIGLGASVGFLAALGWSNIFARIASLGATLWDLVSAVHGVEMYGDRSQVAESGILSFNVRGCESQQTCVELWTREQVLVSPGIHGSPLALRKLGLTGTVRASVHCYTSEGDLERLRRALVSQVAAVGKAAVS